MTFRVVLGVEVSRWPGAAPFGGGRALDFAPLPCLARGGLCGRGYGLGQRVSGKGFAGKGAEAPHPEFLGYDWVPVNHGHRPFGAGGTHTSKQCAADSSHLSATSTAPQRCSRRRSHRLTCHGHSPRPAALPPTILVSVAAGARPQSAGEAGMGRRSDHASSTQTAQLRPCAQSRVAVPGSREWGGGPTSGKRLPPGTLGLALGPTNEPLQGFSRIMHLSLVPVTSSWGPGQHPLSLPTPPRPLSGP